MCGPAALCSRERVGAAALPSLSGTQHARKTACERRSVEGQQALLVHRVELEHERVQPIAGLAIDVIEGLVAAPCTGMSVEEREDGDKELECLLGLNVQSLGFRVYGDEERECLPGSRVQGLGFRVYGDEEVECLLGFRV